MIIGPTARNVTIVCNLLPSPGRSLWSRLATEWTHYGILYNFLARPSRTDVVLVQYVNDLVTSMS